MQLIAERMIRGADVTADPGDSFEASAKMGAALIGAGVAREAPAAKPAPEPLPAPVIESAEEQAEDVERAVEAPPARRATRKKAAANRRKQAKKVSGE